jgi:hypothetical protein
MVPRYAPLTYNKLSEMTFVGEANANNNRDKYICTFSKMIEYWRTIWHVRTNFTTNPRFPFGFVQVRRSFFINLSF